MAQGSEVFKVALQDGAKDTTQLSNKQVKESRTSNFGNVCFSKYFEEDSFYL